MVKEIKKFVTSDGKEFKTEAGAKNHENRMFINARLAELELTKEQVSEKLKETAERHISIRTLLKYNPDWTKWAFHQIKQVLSQPEVFLEEYKETIYVRQYRAWREIKEEEIAREKGPEFTDSEKHCKQEQEHLDYKVVKVEEVNKYTQKVILDYKYETYEKAAIKLKAGLTLEENEISSLIDCYDTVYTEEGENRRWTRSVLTVVNIDGTNYAIDWEEGLTESQENMFYNQPYKVKVEEVPVTIVKTVVTPL